MAEQVHDGARYFAERRHDNEHVLAEYMQYKTGRKKPYMVPKYISTGFRRVRGAAVEATHKAPPPPAHPKPPDVIGLRPVAYTSHRHPDTQDSPRPKTRVPPSSKYGSGRR